MLAARFLKRFDRLLSAIFDATLRRPRLGLALTGVIAALALLSLAHLRFELTVFEIDDPGFESAADLRAMRRDFKEETTLEIVFSNRDATPLGNEQLCRIRSWLERLDGQPAWAETLAIDVFSPFSLRHPRFDTEPSRLTYPEIFGPLHLSEAACPTDTLQILRSVARGPWSRVLVAPDGRDLNAQISLAELRNQRRFTGVDPDRTAELLADLKDNLLAADPRLRIDTLGTASTSLHIRDMMVKDSVLQLFVLITLLGFFRWAFGTWKIGLLLVATLLFSIVCTYAGLVVLGWPFDVLSNNLFIVLCVSGIEDFLFVCYLNRKRGRDGAGPQAEGLIASFRELLVPGFFTSLTTVMGFVSLTSSSFEIIGRFGLLSGWSALVEWVATFLIVPMVLRVLPASITWVRARPPRRVLEIPRARTPLARRLAWGSTIGLFLTGVVGFPYLNYEAAFAKAFPSDHPHAEAVRKVRASRGWEDWFYVVFDDANDTRLQSELASRLRAQSGVVKIDTFDRQLEHLVAGLAPDMERVVRREITASGMYERYVSSSDQARLGVFVSESRGAELAPILDRVRQWCGTRCRPVGEAVVLDAYSKGIARTLADSFILSLLLVGSVIGFLARALGHRRIGVYLACTVWAPVTMVGALALFQVRIDFITSMFLANIVGLAGDNIIQYFFQSPRGDVRTGLSALGGATLSLTVLLLLLCLAGFAFSSLIPVRMLGGMLASGFILVLVSDVYLLGLLTPASVDE